MNDKRYFAIYVIVALILVIYNIHLTNVFMNMYDDNSMLVYLLSILIYAISAILFIVGLFSFEKK
jgi:hypothetical protein